MRSIIMSIKELHWKKSTANSRQFSILDGLAELCKINRKNIISAAGGLETGVKRYRIKSQGVINLTLTISEEGQNANPNEMELKWIGPDNGKFVLASGEQYLWKCTDLLRGRWAWLDAASQNRLIAFKPTDLLHRSGNIESECNNLDEDIEELLAALGTHLTVFFNSWIMIGVLFILLIVLSR